MNVVLISIDSLRYDCVGYQPDKRNLRKFSVEGLLNTPTLDGIAEKSLCFTNCFSTNTYTTAAHASLFTGLYPPNHGVRAFFQTKMRPDVLTLAEAFRNNGYQTVMATDRPELFIPIGIDRGFEHVFVRDDLKLFDFLSRSKGKKLFLFAHFFDVHAPYMYSPVPLDKDTNTDYHLELDRLYAMYGKKRAEKDDVKAWKVLFHGEGARHDTLFSPYVKGVSKFDDGRFRTFIDKVNSISPLDDSMFVIFSDHGEGTTGRNSEHFGHAGDLFDSVIRVPLMIRHPDLKPGVSERITSLVDIYPTVLGLSGIDTGNSTDGKFMAEGREHIYAETWFSSKQNLILEGHGKSPEKKFKGVEWILRQRCIRTPLMKFVITGDREPWLEDYLKSVGPSYGRLSKYFRVLLRIFRTSNFDKLPAEADAILSLPNDEFVKRAYRAILTRFEDTEGFGNYMGRLESGKMSKQEALTAFMQSREYSDTPAFSACDCKADPDERRILNPFGKKSLTAEAQNHYNLIRKLNGAAVRTEKIWGTRAMWSSGSRPQTQAEIAMSIREKEAKSIDVIRRAVSLYGTEKIGVAWTAGKDSTTVLSLIRQAFDGRIPFKVINLDTSVKFSEIYEFRDRLKEEWSLDLSVFKNEDAINAIAIARDHMDCCYQLKTVPLNRAIESLGLECLITGVRWDEQEARSDEEYFAFRDAPPHVRVQPILHFTEKDIWRYIKEHEVPYCNLYEKGYRSLGCAPCTAPSDGTGPERQGRAMDKEQVMQALRDLGYF